MMPNLTRLLNQIREIEKKYGRIENSVQLIAVTKRQPLQSIIQAFDAGQRHFAENYLQDAMLKFAEFTNLDTHSPCIWHFIGSIQRNKTRKIAEYFDWVHSVDSLIIAKRLNDQRPENLPPLNICIEVNLGHETQKSGVSPSHLKELALACTELPRLRLRGLMTLPPIEQHFELQRIPFRLLRGLQHELIQEGIALDTLSMGMSNDMEAAIAEGATFVRIGTALFGERLP